jgi:hypothetical protein
MTLFHYDMPPEYTKLQPHLVIPLRHAAKRHQTAATSRYSTTACRQKASHCSHIKLFHYGMPPEGITLQPHHVIPLRHAAKRHHTAATSRYSTTACRQKAPNCSHITLFHYGMPPEGITLQPHAVTPLRHAARRHQTAVTSRYSTTAYRQKASRYCHAAMPPEPLSSSHFA